MNLKSKDMDMLHGALTGKLLYFTLPIALSSMLQQLFNAADTAVVGYFGNAGALAAVGTNTEIIALIVTVSSGLFTTSAASLPTFYHAFPLSWAATIVLVNLGFLILHPLKDSGAVNNRAFNHKKS